jgi:hypothetical protein
MLQWDLKDEDDGGDDDDDDADDIFPSFTSVLSEVVAVNYAI